MHNLAILSTTGAARVGGGGCFKPTKPRGRLCVARGLIHKMQGDGSTTKPGGIMVVAMLGFDLAWV